jgi:hypothetical protein
MPLAVAPLGGRDIKLQVLHLSGNTIAVKGRSLTALSQCSIPVTAGAWGRVCPHGLLGHPGTRVAQAAQAGHYKDPRTRFVTHAYCFLVVWLRQPCGQP